MRTSIYVLIVGVFASVAGRGAETELIATGSTWKYFIGTQEASSPQAAWRSNTFNDTSWLSGPAPIGYSTADPKTGYEASIATSITLPSPGATLYMRKTFNIPDLSGFSALALNLFVDDGAVAWINGVEVSPRINAPTGNLGFNAAASAGGEEIVLSALFTNRNALVVGQNTLAVHVLNSPTASSDLHLEANLTLIQDVEPPVVVELYPEAGSTRRTLTSIELGFNEAVNGVQNTDLLINGVAATNVTAGSFPGQYTFRFPNPPAGTVNIAWAAGHGITDTAGLAFAGGSWSYTIDPNIPVTPLILNELMADNNDTINDEDGDSSDWLEIYNPGAADVDLSGYILMDSGSLWRFPAGASIQADRYLVIFASGKNKTNIAGRLHTNFELSRNGENLILADPQTNIISAFTPYPALGEDVSYGRDAGDPRLSVFFTSPTPGARNASSGPGFSPEVIFSRDSGTFIQSAPFSLILTSSAPNTVIRYTIGTNTPGPTSTEYTSPILISATTLIRARAFTPGLLPGPITSKSYIALQDATNVVNFNSTLPIVIMHNLAGTFSGRDDRPVVIQVFEPNVYTAANSALTNQPTMAEFGIAHLRGSSTLGYVKGSFFLEVQDEFRDGKAVPMLGLPEDPDWILYAPNNFEPILIKNPIAHRLSRDLGEYASRTRMFELYLKDDASPGPITSSDYNGIYVLEEKIKRDRNRVNVANPEPEHLTEPEVTGGYIWSIDREEVPAEPNLVAGGATMQWVDPKGSTMVLPARAPQLAWITAYWNAFGSALNDNARWTNPVTGFAAYIDVDSWVRRHIHEVLTHNIDALRLSGYFFKDRLKKIEYGPSWDYDRTMSNGYGDSRSFNPRTFRAITGDLGTDYFNFLPWWQRLLSAPDFWQRWIDKYQEYRLGPLSLENITNRIDEIAREVRPAHVREYTRWGANHEPRNGIVTAESFTHNFGPRFNYENEINWQGVWFSNRLQFIDTNFLDRPFLSFRGGLVQTGFSFTISPASKAGSSVIFTLDGSDPRLSGGRISPSAFSNNAPMEITISNNVKLVARSWNPNHRNLTGPNNPPISSPWSGPMEATVYTHIPALRITEIMYHPIDPPLLDTNDAHYEYIEFRNIGTTTLNLNGYTLRGGVDFDFANISLAPGERGVLVANQGEFIERYGGGRRILGQYAGLSYGEITNVLDNAGEELHLRGAAGETILKFDYEDDWYPTTDGFGFSLVVVNENAPTDAWDSKTNWRPSGALGGSPGLDDPAPPNIPQVVINEVLTHSGAPPPYDTIELLNLSGTTANIGHWYLTDNFRDPKKYRIPGGTMLAPGAITTFDELQFNVGATAFSLSSHGEQVYLFSGDAAGNLTGYAQGFDFGAAASGRTFGRHVLSTGAVEEPPQATATLGAPNSGPLIGPIVITEVHYRPMDIFYRGNLYDNDFDEFIELHNISGSSAPLYDPANPQNTWRLNDAVEFTFPTNVSIPAGGYLLVVNFNPTNTTRLAQFRERYSLSPSVPIYGPYGGKLDNSDENLELRRPDLPEPPGPPDFGFVPSLLVERVRYRDEAPWPLGADGYGNSLQRITPSAYGNDPINWVAAPASPGAAYVGGPLPVISGQPTNRTIITDSDTTFSVTADGTNLRYQWAKNGTILRGATGSSLTLTGVKPGDSGEYSVVVMNDAGAVASSNAVLQVFNAARIVSHPQTAIVQAFAPVTFGVQALSDLPITYQWYFNGSIIPGATRSIYHIPSAGLEARGEYAVRVTDDINSVLSDPAQLIVLIQPLITLQPTTNIVAQGSTVVLSIGITNTATLPLGYRWRRGGGLVVSNSLNEYSDFLVITNVQGSNLYDIVVYNLAQPSGRQSTRVPVVGVADADSDGLPDYWEAQNGLSSSDPNDANADSDGDGLTNAEEFAAGTDPQDEDSFLSVELVSAGGQPPSTLLRFKAVAQKTYTIQYSDNLNGGWQTLSDFNWATADRVLEFMDTSPNAAARYYRLVTPKQ